jgi:hypothetical protein
MFKLERKELYDDTVHLGTVVPRYKKGPAPYLPTSIKILLRSELKHVASPHFLKKVRDFVKSEFYARRCTVEWF